MRKFDVSCLDTKTGKEMLLADCSFNQALQWLESELGKENCDIIGIGTKTEFGDCIIYTMPDTSMLTEEESKYVLGRDFYYDETRGLLLGD